MRYKYTLSYRKTSRVFSNILFLRLAVVHHVLQHGQNVILIRPKESVYIYIDFRIFDPYNIIVQATKYYKFRPDFYKILYNIYYVVGFGNVRKRVEKKYNRTKNLSNTLWTLRAHNNIAQRPDGFRFLLARTKGHLLITHCQISNVVFFITKYVVHTLSPLTLLHLVIYPSPIRSVAQYVCQRFFSLYNIMLDYVMDCTTHIYAYIYIPTYKVLRKMSGRPEPVRLYSNT